MRCEHDTATAELPGLPALPVKAPRTTQADRKRRRIYFGPKERARCETCANSVWSGIEGRCMTGDYPVQRGGICSCWLRRE